MKRIIENNNISPPMTLYKLTIVDYIVTVILVNLSGNLGITIWHPDFIVAGTLIFLLILLVKRREKLFTPWFVLVFLLFFCISLVQGYIFSFFPVRSVSGFLMRLSIGYLAIRLVKDFPRAYVNVIYYTGILSLMLYIPDQIAHNIGFDFKSLFEPINQLVGFTGTNRYHIIVHNFQLNIHSGRNSSYFGEPGLFASHLLLALIFLSFIREKITSDAYIVRVIVLTVCILTTFSTTGYYILILIIPLHLKIKAPTIKESYRRLFYSVIIIFVLGFATQKALELPFMEEKVRSQYEIVLYQQEGWQNTRFGGVLFEWEYIKQHPIIGWGLHETTRYSLDPHLAELGLGGGTFGFITNFGIIGIGLFCLGVYMGFLRLTNTKHMLSGYCMLLILLMGMGQPLYHYIFFMSLLFLKENDAS